VTRCPKKLLWLAGADAAKLQSRADHGEDVVILDYCWEIDRMMVASDAAITKANRMTIFELQHLGIPTAIVSWGLNPIDDQATRNLPGTVWIDGRTATDSTLLDGLEALSPEACVPEMNDASENANACALRIYQALTRGRE
jgi:UDP-N-acetylglucosamine:LPS N-acetylglucosamine transferase